MIRLAPFAAVLGLVIHLNSVRSTESEARDLAKKFLAHLSANSPIAGTFVVESTTDPSFQKASREAQRAQAKKEGYGVSFGADKPKLICRWAWDGPREMVDTLDGSNVWRTLVRTPEAYLQGTIKDNFNLDKAGLAAAYRPASFYFLLGGVPWSDALKDCKFRIEDAPQGSPPNCVSLVVTSERVNVRLVVNPSSGELHGHRQFLPDGKLFGELRIEKTKKNSDGRLFPTAARFMVFNGRDSVMHTHELNAREVAFPASQIATEEAMRLVLAKGALINDMLLSQQIVLKQSATAADVISGVIPGEPAEFKISKPRTGTQSPPEGNAWQVWAIAIATSLPLGLYLAIRGIRIWRARTES